MGTGTFVRPVNGSSKPAATGMSGRTRMDMPLLLVIITLLIFGLLMLYSASWDYCIQSMGLQPTCLLERQLGSLFIGLIVAGVAAIINYHFWRRFVVVGLLVVLGLLTVVLVSNQILLGSSRYIFGGSIQPSEFAKLITIFYVAVWLSSKEERLRVMRLGLIPLGVILGIISAFILVQPDLSAAITVCLLGALLFFIAGGDTKQVLGTMAVTILVGGSLVYLFNQTGPQRIREYVSGLENIEQSGYHVTRSLEAVAKGGVFGVGIGKATTKYNGLPFPPTDSIFAVIVEETGMVGACVLVILFGLIMWRGVMIAQRAPDKLGMLLAGGITFWIVLEGYLNMAGMVGVMPFAGNVLPFMSSGGSNLVSSLAGIGVLLNISRQSEPVKEDDNGWRSLGAFIDLRRRDRRRSESSARRVTVNRR